MRCNSSNAPQILTGRATLRADPLARYDAKAS
jgi:hypothetical protein